MSLACYCNGHHHFRADHPVTGCLVSGCDCHLLESRVTDMAEARGVRDFSIGLLIGCALGILASLAVWFGR